MVENIIFIEDKHHIMVLWIESNRIFYKYFPINVQQIIETDQNFIYQLKDAFSYTIKKITLTTGLLLPIKQDKYYRYYEKLKNMYFYPIYNHLSNGSIEEDTERQGISGNNQEEEEKKISQEEGNNDQGTLGSRESHKSESDKLASAERTNNDDQFDGQLLVEKCFLCDNPGVLNIYNVYLCGNIHKCKEVCEIEGNCREGGKEICRIEIPLDQLVHQGKHCCGSDIHSCNDRCPNCNTFCNKIYNHSGKHKSFHHLIVKDGCTCLDTCSNYNEESNHFHCIACNGGDECGEKLYPDQVMHNRNEDYWNCEMFWEKYYWKVNPLKRIDVNL